MHTLSGFFYMPQICDMGQTALLPLRRKACWGFFRPEKSNGFGRVWTRELGYQRFFRIDDGTCWTKMNINYPPDYSEQFGSWGNTCGIYSGYSNLRRDTDYLNEVFLGLPQLPFANVMVVSQIRPLPFISLSLGYTLSILPLTQCP